MPSDKDKPSLSGGQPASENPSGPRPALAALKAKLTTPEGPGENETVVASPELAGLKLGLPPPSSPSENVTIVASPDLAVLKVGLPPPGGQNESLALALEDLKAAPADKKTGDESGGPPKLKVPSSLDLAAPAPDAAALATTAPAQPEAAPSEPPKEAAGVATPPRESPVAKAKEVLAKVVTTLRTRVPEYWAKLLDFVRSRLPEKHRGISQRVLGLGVGAVLGLPILILLFVFSGDESSSSSSKGAAIPGFATERDMEKAVSGGVRDLEKLAVKYPNDSRIFRALARGHVGRRDYAGAIRALSTLARLDPTMASDDEMSQVAASAAVIPETSDAAIALLESFGDKGVSVLSDLAERTPSEPWKSKLNASLQKGTVRATASEPTLVLLDLRAAQRCEDKRTLLRRAAQQGDARTLAYLQALQQSTTGCGPAGQTDCWPCLRKGTALKATLDTITKRLGG